MTGFSWAAGHYSPLRVFEPAKKEIKTKKRATGFEPANVSLEG